MFRISGYCKTGCNYWLKKGDRLYPKSIITDGRTVEKTYQPFSLQHLAAAKSVGTLILHDLSELCGIYNMMKDNSLYVRIGSEHSRKQFKFEKIMKHVLYIKIKKPLATAEFYMKFIRIPHPSVNNVVFMMKSKNCKHFSYVISIV